MQPRTREVLDYLADSDRILDDALAGVPAVARGTRPAPERWSPAEIVEHLGVVESSIVGLLTQQVDAARANGLGAERATDPVIPTVPTERRLNRDAQLVARARSQRRAGREWAAAREAYRAARERLRAFVEASDGLALSDLIVQHPVLGPLNVYGWIVFLGAHEQRHAAQIRETGLAIA
jgi:hypothetical protein